MASPVIESMDILDHMMQNVDRNLRNILVTVPKTCDLNNDQCAMKIRLIDHSSCFGMNKYNFISIVATKFHSDHLSIAKFNPIQKARQFERYLNKIPVTDRNFIGETLARFAAISDEQLDDWIGKMQDLLSSNQYIRIYNVLRRQRDIARDVIVQWRLSTGFWKEVRNLSNVLCAFSYWKLFFDKLFYRQIEFYKLFIAVTIGRKASTKDPKVFPLQSWIMPC